jgi:hypothetical protein
LSVLWANNQGLNCTVSAIFVYLRRQFMPAKPDRKTVL